MITNTGTFVAKTMDTMFAWDLDSHIMGECLFSIAAINIINLAALPEGYKFLMQNCKRDNNTAIPVD
jgi:hypothetical protein